MFKIYISILVLLITSTAYSQEEKKGKFSDAIEDNSFLIEEAYNQEDRVVQHISNGEYFSDTHSFFYTFTQEWPISTYKHQFSYTIPYTFLNSNQHNGVGDIMLNYRYQLFYNDDWACVSPRFSVIIPSGSKSNGLGNGAWGFQLAIPASKRISEHFTLHLNLGLTYLNGVKSDNDLSNTTFKKDIVNYFSGLSVIYLANKNLNFMLESLEYFNSNIDSNGQIIYTEQTVINPGIRYAININKLQIVPGISLPVSFQNSQKPLFPVFFYLSFEHPY